MKCEAEIPENLNFDAKEESVNYEEGFSPIHCTFLGEYMGDPENCDEIIMLPTYAKKAYTPARNV